MKYPIGIQSFPKMREEGFTYVDKTRYIISLINNPGHYFLSRDYAGRYAMDPRALYLIGANFSDRGEQRGLTEWQIVKAK